MRRPVVLIVDDDRSVCESLELLLEDRYETIVTSDGSAAVDLVGRSSVDIVLMDVNLPVLGGIEALEKIKDMDSDVEVVMLSASDSAQLAVSSLKKGAYDYITKPFVPDELLSVLKRLTDRLELKSEVDYLKEELQKKFGHSEIISRSPKMKKIFDLIQKVSRTSSNVLITGESGTGKELVARAIQSSGDRRDKPFVAVNCGAVPAELMESELFGHEKGAFTGAHARKIGKFEYADGGTVFLDEVGTLPMHLQIKLLRFLQEKTFERVGSYVSIKVDVRVIAATNVDLEKAVRNGAFREDLYYRLKVVPVELPPLRERIEDVPLLVRHFLEKHAKACNKHIKGMTPAAVKALSSYSWPGNIRELENLIERLVVLAKEGDTITYEDLPVGMFCMDNGEGSLTKEARNFREACRAFERRYIINILNNTNWNRTQAARKLNMHRNTLLLKMKQLGIKETSQ